MADTVNKIHLRNLDDELYALVTSGGIIDTDRFISIDYLNEYFFRKKKDDDRLVDTVTYSMIDNDAVNNILAGIIASPEFDDAFASYRKNTVKIKETDLDPELKTKIDKCALLISLTNADSLLDLVENVDSSATQMERVLERLTSLESDMGKNFAADQVLEGRVDAIDKNIDEVILDHITDIINDQEDMVSEISERVQEAVTTNFSNQVSTLQDDMEEVQSALELMIGTESGRLEGIIDNIVDEVTGTLDEKLQEYSGSFEAKRVELEGKMDSYDTAHNVRFGQIETRLDEIESDTRLTYISNLQNTSDTTVVISKNHLPASVLYSDDPDYGYIADIKNGSARFSINSMPNELVRNTDNYYVWLKGLNEGTVKVPVDAVPGNAIKKYLNNGLTETTADEIFWTFLKQIYRGTSYIPVNSVPPLAISGFLEENPLWQWLVSLNNGDGYSVLSARTMPMAAINSYIAQNDTNYGWLVRLMEGNETLEDDCIPATKIETVLSENTHYQWLLQVENGTTKVPDNVLPEDPIRNLAADETKKNSTVIWAAGVQAGTREVPIAAINETDLGMKISARLDNLDEWKWIKAIKQGLGDTKIPDGSVSYTSVQQHVNTYLDTNTTWSWLNNIKNATNNVKVPDGSISYSSVQQHMEQYFGTTINVPELVQWVYRIKTTELNEGDNKISGSVINQTDIFNMITNYLSGDSNYQWLRGVRAGANAVGNVDSSTVYTYITSYLGSGGADQARDWYDWLGKLINGEVTLPSANYNSTEFHVAIRNYLNASYTDQSPVDSVIWKFCRELYKLKRSNSATAELSVAAIKNAIDDYFVNCKNHEGGYLISDRGHFPYYLDWLVKLHDGQVTLPYASIGTSTADSYTSSYLNNDPNYKWLVDVREGYGVPKDGHLIQTTALNIPDLFVSLHTQGNSQGSITGMLPLVLTTVEIVIQANDYYDMTFVNAQAQFIRVLVKNTDTEIGDLKNKFILAEGVVTVAFISDTNIRFYNEKDNNITIKIVYYKAQG